MSTTTWDKIYKDFLDGGPAYASLHDNLENLHHDFVALFAKASFRGKNALDIGCGAGIYLQYLYNAGFQVTGIDSSESAVQMTTRLLNGQGTFIIADMYEYPYPESTYDFIISHRTLHHGSRQQVITLLERLYTMLLPEGMLFISLPSNEAKTHWIMMEDHEVLDDGTCIPMSGPEKGLPHSFFSHGDIEQLFSSYHKLEIRLDECDSRWIITASK